MMIGRINPGMEPSRPGQGNTLPAGDQLWASALKKAKKNSTVGGQEGLEKYAFDSAGSRLRIDTRNPAASAKQQWSKWLEGAARLAANRVVVGLAAKEALEGIAGQPPLVRGDYALAPDLSIRVWGEGHNGPNDETAIFLRRNAMLGQGADEVLPVHVERTPIGPKFDLAELERAYGKELPEGVLEQLGFTASLQSPPPSASDSDNRPPIQPEINQNYSAETPEEEEAAQEAIRTGRSPQEAIDNVRYSGKLIFKGEFDKDAEDLARKLNGESGVYFENDPAKREFDVISDAYVAQTKNSNVKNPGVKIKDQIRTTFIAAKASGREPYFHYEQTPHESILKIIRRYEQRYNLTAVIDTTPLSKP